MAVTKQGRLAQILQQEYKSKGVFSGAATAGGKRLAEMFDIRNYLFSGGGVGSVIGRKIFGKGYSATPTTDTSNIASKISTPTQGIFSKESVDILVSIKSDTRISAKNSTVLPGMARDMNLVRQNIAKLVKLQGGSPAYKADMFFKKASEREKEYESQFRKPTTTPAQIKTEEKSSGLFGILGALLSGLGSLLTTTVATIGTTIGGIIGGTLTAILGAMTALGAVIASALTTLGLGKLIPRITLPTPGRTPTPTPTPQKPGGAGPTPSPSQTNRNPPTGDKVKPSQRYGGKGPGSLSIPKDIQPTDKWGKFLKFVEKKSPKLFQMFGTRLMAAGGLLALPLVGWIMALINLGLVGWAAYEVYQLWKEFSGITDEDENTDNTSPTNMSFEKSAMANLIYDRFREAGFSDVQARAAVANAEAESSLNPNAHNTRGEDSVGLFQMNRKGGLGEGYTVEELKDPETNISLAINAAKRSKNFRNATTIESATEAFVRDVERPKDKAGAIAKRTKIALESQNQSFGTRVDYASSELAASERAMKTGAGGMLVQDNSVKNISSASGGSQPVASAYNPEWERLMSLVVDPA
jgi:hypothetical protein